MAAQQTGYLGLGSNVGDPAGHLRAAVELLEAEGIEVDAVSSTYVTEPVGEILDQPDFLNAAVRIRTDLEPEDLLDACKRVEAERGRSFDAPRHSPRPLDVDLLLLGDLELSTDRLTLPHREVTTRRFVLVPLLELDPELALPDGPPATPAWWMGRAAAALGSGAAGRATRPGGPAAFCRGSSGTRRAGELRCRAVLDRRAEVVQGHRQADAGGDLEVGGIELPRR